MVEPYTLEEFDAFEGDLDVERLRETVVEMETAWVECARLRRGLAEAQAEADRLRARLQPPPLLACRLCGVGASAGVDGRCAIDGEPLTTAPAQTAT